MVFLEIDFDTSKELLRGFNVQSQSTMIVFKGKTEIARSVADTNPASIAAFLRKAL